MIIKEASFEGKSVASRKAARLLRALSHPCRLQVLCALAEREYCVSELMKRTRMSQSALSQHLARLRASDTVMTRRDAQTIYYRIKRPEVMEVVNVLGRLFCSTNEDKKGK